MKKFKIGTHPIDEKLWKDIGQSPEYEKENEFVYVFIGFGSIAKKHKKILTNHLT